MKEQKNTCFPQSFETVLCPEQNLGTEKKKKGAFPSAAEPQISLYKTTFVGKRGIIMHLNIFA